MDGLDNKNISQNELFDFLEEIECGKSKCPKCGEVISISKIHTYDRTNKEIYIRGMKPYLYAKISCNCGFENEFNTSWCIKGIDGETKKKYCVGLAVGGVMEKPDYNYENIEEIEALSEAEAIQKYNEKHGKQYWSAVAI